MKTIQVRVEDQLKDDCDRLFDNLGTSTNEAIKIFLKASLRAGGIPFEVALPKEEKNPSQLIPNNEVQKTLIKNYLKNHPNGEMSDNDDAFEDPEAMFNHGK